MTHWYHLVTAAKQQCDQVALTIFVNPAQFAPTEDLSSYPRTLQSDLDKLAVTAPQAAVLVPRVAEMYPGGIELDVSKQNGAFVEVKGLSHQLEGITRPHFFRGVATVVTKFLNIVQPEHVYFGQKDGKYYCHDNSSFYLLCCQFNNAWSFVA